MHHYHISWSRKTGGIVDWERFGTLEEARTNAEELVLPGETYSLTATVRTAPTS